MSSERKRRRSAALKEEDAGSIRTELQELLRPLLVSSRNADEDSLDLLLSNEQALWEEHIGPYEQVLLSAQRHMARLVADKFCARSVGYEPVYREHYEHPCMRTENAPEPDVFVWLGLFLDRPTELRLRQEDESERVICSQNALTALQEQVGTLSKVEAARNVLRYLAEEAERLDAPELLRFCATYGLSGAMTNVLQGKYHANTNNLTVDTPLATEDAPDGPENREEMLFGFGRKRLRQPVVVVGAALGHRHVVLHAIRTLHADFTNGTTYLEQHPFLPIAEEMLLWAICKSNKPMVKCLVSDCGFQFRWVYRHMRRIYEMLFHIDGEGDEYGVWRARCYNPFKYESRRSQRRYRSKGCYQEKQAMLQTMIELGLPRELLIPEIHVSLDRDLEREAKAKGLDEPDRQMYEKFAQTLSRSERKARAHIGEACAEYNAVVVKKDRKTIEDYYQFVLDMWKNQESAQAVRSVEFEPLDPRWRDVKKKAKKYDKDCFINWWEKQDEEDFSSDDSSEGPMDIHDLEEATGVNLVYSESSDEGLE